MADMGQHPEPERPTEQAEVLDHPLGRRGILTGGGLLFTGAVLQSTMLGRQILGVLDDARLSAEPTGTRVRVERIRRADDMLVANLVLVDLAVDITTRGSFLTVATGREAGYVGLVLPGQSFGETAFPVAPMPPPAPPAGKPLAQAELALPSVLAFKVADGQRIPYTVAGILGWIRSRPPYLATTGTGVPTSIEAPYRLKLKPQSTLVWDHSTHPKRLTTSVGETVELWHTRLSGVDSEGEADHRATVMKVAVGKPLTTAQTATPLEDDERTEIHRNAELFEETKSPSTGLVVKGPVRADLLMLSSLGATLTLHGYWPGSLTLVRWDHRATLGRDQYVRIEEPGFLAPYGHPAMIVKETWRKFVDIGGAPVAILVKKFYLLVREPVVDTSLPWVRQGRGSQFPFVSVRCETRLSDPLTNATGAFVADGGVPESADGPLRFLFSGTDWVGREISFTSGVRWVPANSGHESSTLWNSDPEGVRRVTLGGARTAVAPEAAGRPGGTTLPVSEIDVRVQQETGVDRFGYPVRARFRPVLARLEAEVPAMTAFTGASSLPHVYAAEYVTAEANPGGIVLQVVAPGSEVIGAGKSGGMMQMPTYQGLSRTGGAIMGTVSSDVPGTNGVLADAAKGDIDVNKLLQGLKLLGAISLADIVTTVTGAAPDLPLPPGVTVQESGGRQTARLETVMNLQQWVGPAGLSFTPRGDKQFRIVVLSAAGGTRPAETSIDARLCPADLGLADLVVLPIEKLGVHWAVGDSPVFDFELGEARYLGALAFVQTLADVASFLGVNPVARSARSAATGGTVAEEPFTVDFDDEGIHLAGNLAVPDVQVGVFTLSGLTFHLGVDLPFGGGLRTSFAFASRDDPFTVTYCMFGGGGYVQLDLDGGEVSQLEVGLSIAAHFGLDIGIASGSVSISAGFALCLPSGGPISVIAFFRAHGMMEVLLVVSLSVTIELELEFVAPDGNTPSLLTGTATIVIHVEVLLLSETATARVTKTFKGAPAAGSGATNRMAALSGTAEQPTFRTSYPASADWLAYTSAFAS